MLNNRSDEKRGVDWLAIIVFHLMLGIAALVVWGIGNAIGL